MADAQKAKNAAALSALEAELARSGHSDAATTRARKELERVRARLAAGAYEIAAFGTNLLDVPDRSAELLTELEFITGIGQDWARVLADHGVSHKHAVVDVGAGWVPKVQLGLVYAGFEGELHVLDKDRKAFDELGRYLRLFRPALRLVHVHADLFDSPPRTYDAVLANHLQDDLLLEAHARAHGVEVSRLYADEQSLREAWASILLEPRQSHERLAVRVAAALAGLAGADAPIILAQYPSYIERNLGLLRASHCALALMELVVTALVETGNWQRSARLERASGHHVIPDAAFRVLTRTPSPPVRR